MRRCAVNRYMVKSKSRLTGDRVSTSFVYAKSLPKAEAAAANTWPMRKIISVARAEVDGDFLPLNSALEPVQYDAELELGE
jgi:hypothetical protein